MTEPALPRLSARHGGASFSGGKAELTRLAPCSLACPLGINVQRYVGQAQQGYLLDALDTILHACPLPGVCAYLCQRPCESACRRGDGDRPVAIRWLKRATVKAGLAAGGAEGRAPTVPPSPWRVGIIGAGPAGLSAAWVLTSLGHGVTLCDKRSAGGGILGKLVPEFRLPRRVLATDVSRVLRRRGVRTHFSCAVEADGAGWPQPVGVAASDEACGAWLWAVGATPRQNLAWPEAEGIIDTWSVLQGHFPETSWREPLFVLGSATSSVAAARVLVRRGAGQVVLVDSRPLSQWSADEEDLTQAKREGVTFRENWLVEKTVVESGRLVALQGRRAVARRGRAPEGTGDVETLPASGLVVPGERHPVLGEEVLAPVPGQVGSYETDIPGVFAAGEAVTGAKTVVESMAAGKGAALAIDAFLRGIPPERPERRRSWAELVVIGQPWESGEAPELAAPHEDLSPARAKAEAGRCLRCGPCAECRHCNPACPHERVLGRDMEGGVVYRAPARRCPGDEVLAATVKGEECTGCGQCEARCPHHAVTVTFHRGGRLEAQVNRPACRGCGWCVARCPFGAIDLTASAWDRNRLWQAMTEEGLQ